MHFAWKTHTQNATYTLPIIPIVFLFIIIYITKYWLKEMQKNAQTTAQLHTSHMPVK